MTAIMPCAHTLRADTQVPWWLVPMCKTMVTSTTILSRQNVQFTMKEVHPSCTPQMVSQGCECIVGEGADSDEGEGEDIQLAAAEPDSQNLLTLDQAVAQSGLIQVSMYRISL